MLYSICVLLIAGSTLFYICYIHGVDEGGNVWSSWYNYVSPFIAIANVAAFLGLTIAIFLGDDKRQKTQEQAKVQNIIINKLQIIEKELSQQEKILRKNGKIQDVYTIYILLYRFTYYFKALPDLVIFSSKPKEKEDAIQVLNKIEEVKKVFIDFYQNNKGNDTLKENKKQDLAYELNFLSAYIEEFEISIIQDISQNVVEPIKF